MKETLLKLAHEAKRTVCTNNGELFLMKPAGEVTQSDIIKLFEKLNQLIEKLEELK